jgi:hypothetical protein
MIDTEICPPALQAVNVESNSNDIKVISTTFLQLITIFLLSEMSVVYVIN